MRLGSQSKTLRNILVEIMREDFRKQLLYKCKASVWVYNIPYFDEKRDIIREFNTKLSPWR